MQGAHELHAVGMSGVSMTKAGRVCTSCSTTCITCRHAGGHASRVGMEGVMHHVSACRGSCMHHVSACRGSCITCRHARCHACDASTQHSHPPTTHQSATTCPPPATAPHHPPPATAHHHPSPSTALHHTPPACHWPAASHHMHTGLCCGCCCVPPPCCLHAGLCSSCCCHLLPAHVQGYAPAAAATRCLPACRAMMRLPMCSPALVVLVASMPVL